MPLEKGGRADKVGNKYEMNCIIYEMLKIMDETNYSVVVEALGDDEIGTDILVTTINGEKEHQQCKARNASKESWDISDLRTRNIFNAWNFQLNRDGDRRVALVSPIGCSFLVDLHDRALNTSGKAEDFYNVQILQSSKEFQKFYNEFCLEMNLSILEKNDIIRSINYLKRIYFKRMSEYEIQERINQNIQFLFRGERRTVYNALVSFISTEDILGKEITQAVLQNYLSAQKIEMRLRDGDNRIISRIVELNKEYRESFKTLQGGLVERNEFDDCIKAILAEKSFIISGSAGCGKSGCTEAILNYCEEENIPHIAIKLDRRIPHINCESWGKELGLSSSIAHAMHCISRNQNAVIVLDQLDALRWTQANSSESLSVCMELIRQVIYLNCEREKQIVIVFVCRKYDLENDNNIRSLFNKGDNLSENNWTTINVQNFAEDTVRKIIGERYEQLSSKLKKLLQIPSNVYIWQHLDNDESYDNCLTTSHLIEKWYQQICKKSITVGVQQKAVIETIECIVDALDKKGRLFIPKQILNVEEVGLDYLISSEMIFVQKNKVGFVHQSILDYFISKRMMQKYFENQEIENIIGEKIKQTPSKRYQIQMFLQNLIEYDSADFISVGKKLLMSEEVRYYVKFVFYEVLGQILEPDDNVTQFIIEDCENEIYGKYLLNNVVFSRKQYVSILRREGILDRWFADPAKKETVFNLLRSICPSLDDEDIDFIRKYAFKNEEDDKKFIECFWHHINQESNKMFELRMMFYECYPDFANEVYIDIKSMIEHCEERTIRLIAFWLKNKVKNNGKQVYRYEETLINWDNSFLVSNGKFVLNAFLKYIPQVNTWEIIYSEWSGKYEHMRGLERCCVELVKKANIAIIAKSPEVFWEYYKVYMGKGYPIFNEVILSGMKYLPESFSNQVINYVCSDLDNNIFDYTSGADDELGLVKDVLRIHGNKCDKGIIQSLEERICHYISPNAANWYKRRIECNKRKEYGPVYWSFWGDLQYELLHCLSTERMGKQAIELMHVLDRRFNKTRSRYYNYNSHSGWVKSPVSGKKIGIKQWRKIITNEKLRSKRNAKWVEVKGGFIESSYEEYARDFNTAVKNEPETMIQLVLKHKNRVLPAFVDSMFSGVEFSDVLSDVNYKNIEHMFIEFPCDMETQRASYFCGIIEKLVVVNWSAEVIEQLKNIAINHKSPELKKADDTNSESSELKDCDMLHSNALNCVRGHAARAIGHLLYKKSDLFQDFNDVVDKMTKDRNPIVRFASLYALWPCYNIDREWTETRILFLYESDIRITSFPNSKNMFFLLYLKYRERVLKIVERCFTSADKRLIEIGGCAVCEFYIRYNEFEKIMFDFESQNEEQVKAILNMAVVYLEYGDYRDLAKTIILNYKNLNFDIEFPLSRIFYDKYIDTEQDKQFLLELMKSKVSKRILYAFVHYLEENAISVIDYAEIIITLCENILHLDEEVLKSQWGIEDNVSKLIIALYDETANSENKIDKQIAEKCLELWDIMFEKQLGSVREISRKLMER